jgi:hypothetical protein
VKCRFVADFAALPFCVIRSVPQIVRPRAASGPPRRISIEKDRNFFFSIKNPLGTTVV